MKLVPVVFTALLAGAVASCFLSRDPRYCDEETPCEDPERPFCDLEGEFEASGGLGNTCIPTPGGACEAHGDCPAARPICELAEQSCRACAGDEECEARDPALPVCTAEGRCAECAVSADCPAAAPICESGACRGCEARGECEARDPSAPICVGSGACEPCGGDGDCPAPEAPVCADSGACRGCAAHDECPSLVCDRGAGACIAESEIIYADAAGGADGAGCGDRASPCASIGAAGGDGALAKVGGDRRWIRLAAGVYAEAVTLEALAVQIAGPEEAAIAPPVAMTDVPAVVVRGDAQVLLDGVTLRSATGTSAGHGLQCDIAGGNRPSLTLRLVTLRDNQATGLSADNCDLTIEQSNISNNQAAGLSADTCGLSIEQTTIAGNQAPGINVNGSNLEVRRSRFIGNSGGGVEIRDSSFTFQNNVIAQNGDAGVAGTPFGGVRIENTGDFQPQVFEHNTVADNEARSDADTSSFECDATMPMTARSNIVYGGLGGAPAVGGSCAHAFSDLEGGASGEGNFDAEPLFVDAASGDYHLQAGSPCIDAADPATALGEDLDGDARPQGEAPDVGADEVPE